MTDEDEQIETDEPQEPRAAKPYLDRIKSAEKVFQAWQDKSGTIAKLYASLEDMAKGKADREFQIFWANLEVLRPTIYSRPPVPVVMPRYKDRKELPRKAAEILERVLATDVEMDDLHETLKLVRDDLALAARGVAWVLDDASCIHVDRIDFVHEPGRKWKEVTWVARRAYLTKEQGEERFPDADWSKAEFEHREDDGEYKGEKKAEVWELWDKSEQAVIWVMPGYEDVLDHQPPLMDVKGFFPCPKPVYGTVEHGTMKPVPDFVYYRDQVEEINELTARISSLSESLRLKGFYSAGVSEIGEAIEAAMKVTDNKAILVPVSNLSALGGSSLKDSIIWLPVREVAEVIASLVQLRKQLIEDVYEITGLSDIMRGSTQASETATAQQLKSQYGSVRVRERQNEMIRVARDILRLKAEVFAELYDIHSLLEMAQVDDLPDMATAQQQMMQAQQQGQQIDPEKIVTIEQVDALFKAEKARPFILDIESDSTIQPDEQAEKESRMEFLTAIGSFIQTAGPMVQAQPEAAPFVAEMLKFTASGFRAGRELGSAIDEFSEQIETMAQQATQAQQGPSPEQIEAQANAQAQQAEMQELAAKVENTQASTIKVQAETEKVRAEIMQIMREMSQPQETVDAA